MKNPLVSVVMPAYNGAKYIAQSIETIINQTYDNWELIIIDDASTDNTVEIICGYIDKRIRLLKNSENKGIAYTTNKGIKASNGKYIALLDDDDLAQENRLKMQVEYLEKNRDIDILGGRNDFIDENGKLICARDIPRNNPLYIKAMLLFECVDFMNSSIIMRKDFLINNSLMYEEGCLGMQDYLFLIKASKIGEISSISDYVGSHRIHDMNYSSVAIKNQGKKRKELYDDFRKKSLVMSGFKLSGDDYKLLNACLLDCAVCCESFNQWKKIIILFDKIISQAIDNKLNYVDELRIYLNKKAKAMFNQINVFEDEDLRELIIKM